jgi:hypothetical protein
MFTLKKVSFPKLLIQLFILLFLTYAVAVGVTLSQRSHELREEASVPDGVATVNFEPSKGNYSIGDVIESNIYFNTAGVALSSVVVRVVIPFSGSTSQVSVEEVAFNPEFLGSDEWVCPIAGTHTQGSNTIIDAACANIRAYGYKSDGKVLLATLKLKVIGSPSDNSITLRFDPSQSIVTRWSDNQDILLIPTSTASYKITPPNRFCTLELSPTSIIYINQNSNTPLSVEVVGRKATSVRFSSPDESLLFETDKILKQPYTTSLRLNTSSDYGVRDTVINAKAYLGNNVLCEDSTSVRIFNPSPTTSY